MDEPIDICEEQTSLPYQALTCPTVLSNLMAPTLRLDHVMQGRSQDFSKGGGGSHCVKHYRHGVFATEYYRLFS